MRILYPSSILSSCIQKSTGRVRKKTTSSAQRSTLLDKWKSNLHRIFFVSSICGHLVEASLFAFIIFRLSQMYSDICYPEECIRPSLTRRPPPCPPSGSSQLLFFVFQMNNALHFSAPIVLSNCIRFLVGWWAIW